MVYSFNQSVSVFPLDAASDQAMVLCEVPAQKGETVRFAMPAALLELLRMFDGQRNVGEVFTAYEKANPGKYSLPSVEQLVEGFLLPKSLLIDLNAPASLPEISATRTSYLFAKVRLIPQHIIYPVARLFGWAFDKRLLIGWLAIFILTHLIFYLWIFPTHRTGLSHFGNEVIAAVMILSLVGAFIHETGHASALVSYGCTKTEIGFGIYFYYPVLYTDVSQAWKLSRQQRAMIDMAGVYFQSVFQILLLGLFFINGSPVPIFFFLFTDLIMFRTMNPFLRMDGYWLVADLFGIFNLRQQSTKLLKYYLFKLFGLHRATQTPLHHLKPGARVALAIYSVLSTVFFFYICEIMIRYAVLSMLPGYPTRVVTFFQALLQLPPDVLKILRLFFELLWRTAVLISLSLFAYRLLKTAFGVVKFLVQTLVQKLNVYDNSQTGIVAK
jgi:putative peptide zinc metalloprotease protein